MERALRFVCIIWCVQCVTYVALPKPGLIESMTVILPRPRTANRPKPLICKVRQCGRGCSSVLMMPSLGMECDGPLEAAAGPPVRRRPTTSWSRAALMNIVRRRTSAGSGKSKEEPGPDGAY